MSHSTNRGFSRNGRGKIGARGEDPSPSSIVLGAWRPSIPFVGVPCWSEWLARSFQSRACGVAQHEESLSAVWSANFRRRVESCRNAVTHRNQLAGDHVEPKPQMPAHVFEEHETGLTLSDHASDIWEEVSGIGVTLTLAGNRERLARVARSDAIHESTPRSSVELPEVSPDGSAVKDSIRHPGEEHVLRKRLDLDVADRAVRRDGERESKFEASDPGTERESIHLTTLRIRRT